MNILGGCVVYWLVLVFVLIIFLAIFEIINLGKGRSVRVKIGIWGGATLTAVAVYQFNKLLRSGGEAYLLEGWYVSISLALLILAIFGLFHFVKDFRTINKKVLLCSAGSALIVAGGILAWLKYYLIPYVQSMIPAHPSI